MVDSRWVRTGRGGPVEDPEDPVLKELRLAETELEDVDIAWVSTDGKLEALRNALKHTIRAVRATRETRDG